jgi:hypothetical protein
MSDEEHVSANTIRGQGKRTKKRDDDEIHDFGTSPFSVAVMKTKAFSDCIILLHVQKTALYTHRPQTSTGVDGLFRCSFSWVEHKNKTGCHGVYFPLPI